MLNERAARVAALRADAILKKDIDVEEWIRKLDEFAEAAVDPYVIWNKIRIRLVELNVDTRDILLLEDSYVRSVQERDPGLSMLAKNSMKISISPDVRAIIQGLVSSAIFSAIIGKN